ncbi:MAG: Rrf2 family transcriptional regulator [Moraxellaceae bacterium]|nr:Rrf2 family transcriptional regulator [Pseudomonadales bacterium]MCP5175450.1 Rrf2 family transcriptional regulator [Moraxellaceae bacterium]HMY27937.1 Rrf2 family transcriptional regulator [Agitococcus sp.]MCP5176007.1 Rrf2 family transcriptional regulator [Moraxellaceae bacterium]HNC86305.1 Rrf2 family transcriptional regulator [Agitococcus sp.]
MQLNKFTDYGLRLLMYLIKSSDQLHTIAQVAHDLHISENHLVKVSHFLAQQGWIISTRGKGGGIRIHPEAMYLSIGEVIRTLEHDEKVIDCLGIECNLRRDCHLNSLFPLAIEQFYQYLNQYQLKDAWRALANEPSKLTQHNNLIQTINPS